MNFSESLEVCTVDPESINFDFFSETGGAEGIFFFQIEPGDESRLTSVSGNKSLVTVLVGLIQDTVSSGVFEPELSILKYFLIISVSLYYIGNSFKVISFSFQKKFSEC